MTLSEIYLKEIPQADQQAVYRILKCYGTSGLEAVKNNAMAFLEMERTLHKDPSDA